MTRTDRAFEYLEMILNEHKLCQRLIDENNRLENVIKNIKAKIENYNVLEEFKYCSDAYKLGVTKGLDLSAELIDQAIKESEDATY